MSTTSRRSITVRRLHVTRGSIQRDGEIHWITGADLVWVSEFFDATGHMEYALACGLRPQRMTLLGTHATLTCVACSAAWEARNGHQPERDDS